MLVTPQATFADMPTPKVVVTVEPLKPYIDDILKGITTSVSLVKASQDPHNAALSPSQAIALAEADIIIMPSKAMSVNLNGLIEKKKKEGAVVIELMALKGAEPLPYPKQNPWLDARKTAAKKNEEQDNHHPEPKDEHDQEPKKEVKDTTDPHLWLDPDRMAAIAGELAVAIGKHAPFYRDTLMGNARSLSRHLRTEVSPAIRAMLKTKKANPHFGNKPFVPFLTYHTSYQYFLYRYRLDAAGFITQQPTEYIGAQSMHEVLKGAESITVRCLVSESETSLVKRIAEDSGARIVLLNPERGYESDEVPIIAWAKNDYERLLFKVAEGFAECL